jgi:MFS family permease
MRAAFAQPGFTRLFAGLTTSMLGDSIMLLVLSIWVKTLTGSSAMAGFTFFFMCIPAIFAPFVGVWLDRIRRKPMLVWGNVLSPETCGSSGRSPGSTASASSSSPRASTVCSRS